MKNQKVLIRRTFLQERFDILIKKQHNGKATFNDLTELDDIVNRDPAIRESILVEMQAENDLPPTLPPNPREVVFSEPTKPLSLLEQLKGFINRLFINKTLELETVILR
jgi:hypothetical protein